MKTLFLLLLLPILAQSARLGGARGTLSTLQQDRQSDEEIANVIQCGQILVRGSEQLTRTELCTLLGEASNNSLDSQLRTSVEASIIKEYHRRGFLEAALSWIDEEKKADAIASTIILIIKEGPVYRLRRLEMAGNVNTRDRVIRRRVALQEGSAFDEELLELSIKRINLLGIFEEFTRESVEVKVNKRGHFVDLTLRLNEK